MVASKAGAKDEKMAAPWVAKWVGKPADSTVSAKAAMRAASTADSWVALTDTS